MSAVAADENLGDRPCQDHERLHFGDDGGDGDDDISCQTDRTTVKASNVSTTRPISVRKQVAVM